MTIFCVGDIESQDRWAAETKASEFREGEATASQRSVQAPDLEEAVTHIARANSVLAFLSRGGRLV